jgi:hypothetical protein
MKATKKMLLMLLSIFVLFGCNIKKFTMPTWDVTLNIPLMNQKYFVSGLIDSLYFFPAPNNNISFQTTGEIQTEPVGEIVVPMDVNTGEIPLESGIALRDGFPLSNLHTGSEIAYGIITDGGLRVNFSDMHTTVTNVTLTLLNVLDDENVPLTITYEGNVGGYLIPLAGYHVGTENSNVIVQDIEFEVMVESTEMLGTTVGFIRLGMIDDLVFSSYRGRISSLSIEVIDNQTHIDIDYPWGMENAIQLQNATISLNIENPIAYPCIITGEFYALNHNSGLSATVDLVDENNQPFAVNPRVGNVNGITEINFTNNVDQLLRIMPDFIEFRSGIIEMDNTIGTIGEIHSTDFVSGSFIANAPLEFVLLNAPITPRDSLEIEISQENRDTIRKNIMSASMQIGIINQLPIGALTTVYFGTNPTISSDDPSTWAFSKSAHIYARTNPNVEQIIPLNLSYDEIMIFTNPKVYMKQTFMFDASDGPVTITASPADYIQVRSIINVQAHVEEK